METVNLLATLWGVALIVLPLSLLLNTRLLKEMIGTHNEAMLYTKGAVIFMLGLVTVLFNNTWGQNWMTIVTVLGWVTLLKGLLLMFWPKKAGAWYMKFRDNANLSYGLFVAILIGLILVYFGFST